MRRLLFALILLGAATRLSAQVSVVPSAFGMVRAGEAVKIEWRSFPRGVEELELLLTVEDRELPIRVTPQLVAGAGVYLWRVPNLPSRRARLKIRYGLDGEEIEDAPSASFEILPAENQAPAVLAFRQGEWWTQECVEDRFPGALTSRQQGERMQEDREAPACSASSQVLPVSSGNSARNGATAAPAGASFPACPILPRRPAKIPARI